MFCFALLFSSYKRNALEKSHGKESLFTYIRESAISKKDVSRVTVLLKNDAYRVSLFSLEMRSLEKWLKPCYIHLYRHSRKYA
jgi:hypothetical protein